MRRVAKYMVAMLLLLLGVEGSAQQMKERGWVRKGNRQYERENYDGSIESYKEALKHDPKNFEAKYDLASALYRAKRFDSAESALKEILTDTTRTEIERGEVAYNLGNTQFAQQKLKEALSSYRYAMRCNPADEDAKFNYAFTKRLLQQQQQQQQQNDQNKEDQEGKNKEGQGEQGGDKKENQDENQPEEQQPQNQQKKEGEGEPKPVEGAMSPEQQDAILQAIQAEEDKTQDKLKERTGVIVRGNKNW